MSRIYHITTRSEWQQAKKAGSYAAPSLQVEGFIHCSTAAQVLEVANAFYRDTPDLVLLCIEAGKLSADLKWESPAHPEAHEAPPDIDAANLFPHVYGTIHLEAVVQVEDFPQGDDRLLRLPHGI